MRYTMMLLLATLACTANAATLDEILAGPQRDPANAARDVYRHPKETLEFFGIKPDSNVVEIWPGGGWYTEILVPYLRQGGGTYYAAALGNAQQAVQRLITARVGLDAVAQSFDALRDPEQHAKILVEPWQ